MRLSDWETPLNEYIASVRKRPHEYGSHDCALYFADAVKAMTGVDPASEFRGKYTTELGSIKALKKFGAGDLESTLDAKFEAIEASQIKRGDGVWNGVAVGVCFGAYALFVGQEGTQEGLVRIPRSDWVKGWRVE